MMKKFLAVMLSLCMLMSLAMAEAPLLGGWTQSEDPTVTEELKALFEKGLEGLVGVSYVPVAYLGSQTVAGTNHCFLAQATVVYPDAKPYYVLVYLYEDLEGNVSEPSFADLDLAAFAENG